MKSGVVAFKIDAKPQAMCCCPQTIRLNGITLFKIHIPKKAPHTLLFAGILKLVTCTTVKRVMAARVTLDATTPTKKKEPPQRLDKMISRSHSNRLMDFISGFMCLRKVILIVNTV